MPAKSRLAAGRVTGRADRGQSVGTADLNTRPARHHRRYSGGKPSWNPAIWNWRCAEALLADTGFLRRLLQNLRAQGVRCGIDDFGGRLLQPALPMRPAGTPTEHRPLFPAKSDSGHRQSGDHRHAHRHGGALGIAVVAKGWKPSSNWRFCGCGNATEFRIFGQTSVGRRNDAMVATTHLALLNDARRSRSNRAAIIRIRPGTMVYNFRRCWTAVAATGNFEPVIRITRKNSCD